MGRMVSPKQRHLQAKWQSQDPSRTHTCTGRYQLSRDRRSTISGITTTGNTLTAVTSGIIDANGMKNAVFSYQWLRSGSAISGATASTYTLVSADAGNTIKVRVSFTGRLWQQ